MNDTNTNGYEWVWVWVIAATTTREFWGVNMAATDIYATASNDGALLNY